MFKTFITILAIYITFVIVKDPADQYAAVQPVHSVAQPAQTPAHTHTLPPDMMALLSAAKKYTRYEGPLSAPQVNQVTQSKLEDMYCRKGTKCPISALYYRNQVYYSDVLSMDDLLSRSILLHEFVHHVQNETMGDTYDCDTWREKEYQAYKIQAQFLRDNGYNPQIVLNAVKKLKCPI
jgi:hypothetical protein